MGSNKKDIPFWAKIGHAKPVTRRDFLSAGLIPFAANMFVPNWVSLLMGNNAFAQTTAADCPTPASLIPFVTINLAGGAAMASNFVPMNAAREPIASYTKLGLGDNKVPIEREFGNATFAGNQLSKFLVGVRAQAMAATIANTAFIGIPCDSQTDTANNKFDISGALTKAGLLGSNLPNMGRVNSRSGINQAVAVVAPPAPLVVSNYNSLLTSIGYTASLGASLNSTQKNSLAKLMSNLNESQTRKLAAIQGGSGIKKVLDCAGIKNVDVVQKGSAIVDPRQNSAFSSIWSLSPNIAVNNRDLIFGAMTYNTLLGQAGTSSFELGGYDYHDNTRTTGDRADQDAGALVGRILQSAAVLQKPIMIYIVSDGSVSCPESTSRNVVWTSDRGSNGLVYLLYYNPSGRPPTSDFQIGQFNDNQAADTTFVTGANPELAATAVFANWCNANKRNDLYDKVAGRLLLDANQLAQVIKIA